MRITPRGAIPQPTPISQIMVIMVITGVTVITARTAMAAIPTETSELGVGRSCTRHRPSSQCRGAEISFSHSRLGKQVSLQMRTCVLGLRQTDVMAQFGPPLRNCVVSASLGSTRFRQECPTRFRQR
jgi:hypothetical protein